MKKNFVFLVLAILAFSISAFAQDYSGTWQLDKEASKLDDRSKNIESMTVTIAQNDKEITLTTDTKRSASPDGGGRMGGGRMGGGMGGTDSATYTLDGKETKSEREGPMGKIPVSLKAKVGKDKLKLTRESTITTPMGAMTMTITDTLSLSADGTTLTLEREQTSPRGTSSNKFVLKKQ